MIGPLSEETLPKERPIPLILLARALCISKLGAGIVLNFFHILFKTSLCSEKPSLGPTLKS